MKLEQTMWAIGAFLLGFLPTAAVIVLDDAHAIPNDAEIALPAPDGMGAAATGHWAGVHLHLQRWEDKAAARANSSE